MKEVKFGNTGLKLPAIVAGCMRINRLDENAAAKYIENAVAQGAYFFDHADIYGGGECEQLFGKAFKMTGIDRDKVFIQSKCGIVRGVMYDLSEEHILESVDGILKRLDTEYLDSLVLHRPDALVEPEEVATAFDKLESTGKVRCFGVSNMKPMQIELLKKCVKQPIAVNQLQLSAAHASMICNGVQVNMMTDGAIDRDSSVLDYCRLKDITIQAWSPLQFQDWSQGAVIKGSFLGDEKFSVLNRKLEELGEKYSVSTAAMAIAWLLRHPANMQVLAGTMNLERFNEICKASEIQLSREDWYQIFKAAGNIMP